ncbi:hypothetical protein ACEPAG_6204 [Sanghuangporus baumii]
MPVPLPPPDTMLVPHGAFNGNQPNALVPATDSSSSLVSTDPVVPPEVTTHLLNTLLLFYQQRKGWVQRSRASLELAYIQGPLLLAPTIGSSSDEQSDSDGSAPFMSSSSYTTNEPTPTTMDMDDGMDSDEPVIKKEEEEEDVLPPRSRALVPLTLRATNAAQAPSSKWLKRKKSFKLHLGPLKQQNPVRPRRHTHTGAPEPSARLLELFGDLLEARMESCLRISRLVRESNRSMLHTW